MLVFHNNSVHHCCTVLEKLLHYIQQIKDVELEAQIWVKILFLSDERFLIKKDLFDAPIVS